MRTPRLLPTPPPGPAVRVAVTLLLSGAGLLVLAALVSGPSAVVWAALGMAAGLPMATTVLTPLERTAVVAFLVACAVAGPWATSVTDSAWAPSLAVALAGALQGAFTRWSIGLAAMSVVVVAVGASARLPDQPLVTATWTAAGAVLVVALAAGLGLRRPPVPVHGRAAWLHATALAAASAVAVGVTQQVGVSHGYWIVLTLAVVLRPDPDETLATSHARLGGTATGVVLAVAVAVLLPTPAILTVAAGCGLLMAAWAVAGDQRRVAVYGVPVVVLVGSSGLAGTGVGLAATRLACTALGVGLSLLLAEGLRRVSGPDRPAAATTTTP